MKVKNPDKGNYNANFPKRLREIMEKNKTTQSQLADYIGVTRQSVGQWQNGSTIPDIFCLEKMADYFNVSTDYLLCRAKRQDDGKTLLDRLIFEMGMSIEDIEWFLDGVDEMINEEDDDFAQILFNLVHRASNEHVYFYLIVKNLRELQRDTKQIFDSGLFSRNLKQELSRLFAKPELAKYKDKIKLLENINHNYNEVYKALKYEINDCMNGIIDCVDSLQNHKMNSKEEWEKILDLSIDEIQEKYKMFQEDVFPL